MDSHRVTENGFLLNYLLKAFPENKRTKAKQLLKFGAVTVNGKIVTQHSHLLKPGDEIGFRPKPKEAFERPVLKTSFSIIFEDDSIIVIDKPAGLLSIATDKIQTRTAYFELTNYVRSTGPAGQERIFIVHRLDRDVSGLLVFAKTEEAKLILQKNWDKAEKKYFALVDGTPKKRSDVIESHLLEDKFRRVYSGKETEYSKHAVTQYRVLRSSGSTSLLEITLLTGRKNQIRVHLSDIGHSIIGDVKYGSASDPAGRLGLHAFWLSFKHPATDETLKFKINLPIQLQKIADRMKVIGNA